MTPMNDVVFDGFSFADNGIVIELIDYMTVAKRRNQLETRANRDGADLVQSLLGTKPIVIAGYYAPNTILEAQNMYDILVQALNRQQRPLYVPHAGSTRKFIVTPENVIIKQPNGLNRITFSFEFVVPEGASKSDTAIILVSQTITSSTANIPLTVQGSTKARPIITMQYNSVTGGTAGVVSVRNARDFIGISVTGNFVTSDTLTVDSENFQIFKGTTLLPPVGRLPSWEAGSGALYYSDTFASRSVTITATYFPANL